MFSYSCLFTLYIIFTLLRYQGIGTKQQGREKKTDEAFEGSIRWTEEHRFCATTGACIEMLISAQASRHMVNIARTHGVFFFTTGTQKFPTGFLPWRSSLTHDRQCNLECIPCRTKHWLGEDDMAFLSSCLHTLRYPTRQINDSDWGTRFSATTRK